MDYVFQAVVLGLLLSLMVGPVFFLLLEISITKGFKSALIFDLGVLLSDVFYIFISLFFAYELRGIGALNNLLLSLIGGGLFLAYGIYNLRFKKVDLSESSQLKNKPVKPDKVLPRNKKILLNKRDIWILCLKGFTLNLLNPGVLIYWLAIVAKGFDLTENHQGSWHIYFFILIVLTVFFGLDVLKAYLANRLKPLVTDKLLKALNILIGSVFIGTGIFLILRQFFKM